MRSSNLLCKKGTFKDWTERKVVRRKHFAVEREAVNSVLRPETARRKLLLSRSRLQVRERPGVLGCLGDSTGDKTGAASELNDCQHTVTRMKDNGFRQKTDTDPGRNDRAEGKGKTE